MDEKAGNPLERDGMPCEALFPRISIIIARPGGDRLSVCVRIIVQTRRASPKVLRGTDHRVSENGHVRGFSAVFRLLVGQRRRLRHGIRRLTHLRRLQQVGDCNVSVTQSRWRSPMGPRAKRICESKRETKFYYLILN